jgi:hypothetical protein
MLDAAATKDGSGEFGRRARESKQGLLEYKIAFCNAGNKAACDEVKQNQN